MGALISFFKFSSTRFLLLTLFFIHCIKMNLIHKPLSVQLLKQFINKKADKLPAFKSLKF